MSSTPWRTRPLVECGRLLSGGTPSKANPAFWTGEIPWFSSKELKSFELRDSELHVSAQGAASGSSLVPAGSVLFVVRGMSLANEFRVGLTLVEATFNQDVKALVPSSDIDPRYLARCLRWLEPRVLAGTEESSHGTKRLPGQVFENLPVPVPPLSEQRRIADILDKADAIRRKRKAATALTEEVLRSVFLETFGDPVANPKGWEVRPLTELCESRQYGTAEKANSEGHGIPVLRMNNLTYSGDVDLTDLKWVALPSGEAGKLDLRDGDVLFNRVNSHELVGKTAVWHQGDGYTFAGYLIRLRLHQRIATGDYVSAAMNMPSMKRTLKAMAKPSINMANISGSDLARVLLPVPPMKAQREYASVRSTVESLRARYRSAEREAESLFASMVDRAFRGELAGTSGGGKSQLGLFDAGSR